METIFLVRHGQDEDNANEILNGRRDSGLTSMGRNQALSTAKKLKDKNIQVIYSSPLKRAYETATIIAQELNIDTIIKHDELIERDFGIFTGKPRKDITKYTKNVLVTDVVTYFLDGEGTEDFPSLLERAKKVLDELHAKHPDERILIVTHGDIGKMIRTAFHGWTWKEGLQTPYFNNTGVLELSKNKDIVE